MNEMEDVYFYCCIISLARLVPATRHNNRIDRPTDRLTDCVKNGRLVECWDAQMNMTGE